MRKLIALLFLAPVLLAAQVGVNQSGCAGAPSTYVLTKGGCAAPVTGGTGVNSFGADATVAPFFTTTVDTPTTAPVLHFSVTNLPAFSFFGNLTSSAATPATKTFTQLTQATSQVFTADDPTYAGTDFGASVANALAAAYAAGGGTVDARGFVCPTNCHIGTADLTAGDGTHPIVLLLPYGTITLDTITSLSRRAMFIYNSNVKIVGLGSWATKITGVNDAIYPLVVANYAIDGAVQNVAITGINIVGTGAIAAGSVSWQAAGRVNGSATGNDMLSSYVFDVQVSGSDYGTLVNGIHGCSCYNRFFLLQTSGHTAGFKSANNSGFPGDFNSNQLYSTKSFGPIGFWNQGGEQNIIAGLDIENSATNNGGGALWAAPTYAAAGTLYTAGDIVTAADGQCTVEPTFKINYVDANGAVNAQGHELLSVNSAGSGCPTNLSAVATTGGTGSALQVNFITSAGMLVLSSSDTYSGLYEEGNATDYYCNWFNTYNGNVGGTNGSSYFSVSCPRLNNGNGGSASNFMWAAAATPIDIGLNKTTSYITWGSGFQYDSYEQYAYLSNFGSNVNLFGDGPAWSGRSSWIYGIWGHSNFNTGLLKPHSGVVATGKSNFNQIANPAAPTLTASSTGTISSAYGLVCNDNNGGTTLPATPTTTISGPAVLGAITSIAISTGGTGYVAGDVGKVVNIVATTATGTGGTATITSVAGGAVTGVALTTAGSGYNTVTSPAASTNNIFSTSGGGTTGSGLKLTTLSAYIMITLPHTDGCNSWTILVGDTSHKLDTSGNKTGSTDASSNVYDFGNGTVAYTPATRNSTGDVSVQGNVTVGGGTNQVYRCSVAGTLPVGALTTVSGNCGTAVAVNLIVN